MSTINIAIDGTSGSGKSTLAKSLAEKLGYVYVDTGAIYRTVGLYAMQNDIDPHDEAALSARLSPSPTQPPPGKLWRRPRRSMPCSVWITGIPKRPICGTSGMPGGKSTPRS